MIHSQWEKRFEWEGLSYVNNNEKRLCNDDEFAAAQDVKIDKKR